MTLSHFQALLIFALLVSVVFALVTKNEPREQLADGGGNTWNINIQLPQGLLIGSAEDVARELREPLRDELQRLGRINAGDVYRGYVKR